METALSRVVSSIQAIERQTTVDLAQAVNRILALDLRSSVDVPPQDNSAVDGYAINTQEVKQGDWINVSQRIPAGTAPKRLAPGTAARIFTGATVPEGADCVVMQEDTDTTPDKVSILSAFKPSQNIRARGQDLKQGATILQRGQILSPQAIGLAASSGIRMLPVFAPLKVAYFSTGDELVEPGTPLQPGQIYNSNRYLLSAMLSNFGCEAIDLGCIPDSLDATCAALETAHQKADVILTTGGASVGEEDHVKSALQRLGELNLWRIALKPGKPFMFGQIQGTPILGLPGNPGAVLVTFCLLARPALLKRMGCDTLYPAAELTELAFSPGHNGKRREFKRVQKQADGRLIAHPNQSSGMLSSACWADGLAVIPEHSELKAGDRVEFYSFANLMFPPYQGAPEV